MVLSGPQQNGLTAAELLELANAVRLEERLVCLYTQGALECGQPQLRSFFAHQAEHGSQRLEELTGLLQSYAGFGNHHASGGGWR